MARVRHSHSDRPRVRLISTPTTEGTDMPTIEGIKYSTQLAQLLDHARAHGWRLEPAAKSTAAGRVLVCYPTDPAHQPIRVTERDAKFHQAHFNNLRREFYAAGLPPLPGDGEVEIAHDAEGHVEGVQLVHNGEDVTADLSTVLASPDGPKALEGIVGALVASQLGECEAELVGRMAAMSFAWATKYSPDRLGAAKSDVESADLEEALRMAAEHEATAARATKALERAEAALAKARDDCKAALARATAAEAKAAAAERAIAPLRAFLSGTGDSAAS